MRAVPGDEAGDLGPGQAGRRFEEAFDGALVGLAEAGVEDPLQGVGDQGVDPVAVEGDDLGQRGTLHEGAHLVDGLDLVQREVHDHASRIAAPPPSGSHLVGNPRPFRLIPRWTTLILAGASPPAITFSASGTAHHLPKKGTPNEAHRRLPHTPAHVRLLPHIRRWTAPGAPRGHSTGHRNLYHHPSDPQWSTPC